MDANQRHIVRVPADAQGQEQQLRDLGFELRSIDGDDPIYRTAILPRFWRARGTHRLAPLEIVDRYERIRVVMTYGSRPILKAGGRTVLQPTARMRLVSLPEYLARSIASGSPVIPDAKWAIPAVIWDLASKEAARARRTAAEFALRRQESSEDRYTARAEQWDQLADRFAPTLLESAA